MRDPSSDGTMVRTYPRDRVGRQRKEHHLKNVLCVTCSATQEAGYSKLLRVSGYNVRIGTISEVVPALRSGTMPVDLVIAECQTLTLAENEMLWQLKRAASSIPVILVSNCMTVESYLRSLALGVHEYLCRPLEDHDIAHVARKLLAGGNGTNKEVR